MKLTTKGKFAVTALLDLAMHSKGVPINLYAISQRHDISLSYLEQLFMKLRKNGIVKSHKGPGGGYTLVQALAEIKISTIIKAVDENMDARTCKGKLNCGINHKKCLTHDLWNNLTNYLYSYLDQISLNDILITNQPRFK